MNAEIPMTEWLSHVAFKGAIVLLIALFSGLLLHRLAAARRYAVWITAVGALVILPPATLLLPAWRVLPQGDKAVMEWPDPQPEEIIESHDPVYLPVGTKMEFSEAIFETPPADPAAGAPAPSPKFSWQETAGLWPHLWLAVSTLLLLRLAWGAGRLHRLERNLQPGTCDLLGQVAQEMKLKRTPRLLIGTENAVPMVWGVWLPRLLLPHGFETWSPEKLRGVLLHELAHLKRRDPLALWTAQWVKALHWFNPLAWLTLRQLRADQERACDDTVLRHGVRPSDYAQHLLDLSRHARLAPGLSLCALTITRCAPVEARVMAILDSKRSREGLTLRWLLGLAGFALLATLPVAMLHAIEGPKPRGRILDRNGVVLAESTTDKARHYPLKTLAGQVLGSARLTKNEVPQPEGWTGIEKQQDQVLRAGKDVSLTLDARVQALAARAMTDEGHSRGAVVVLDPRTGAILALVSLPSVDHNRYTPAFDSLEWAVYDRSEDKPLWDRCVNILAPPSGASVPLTALAAISVGVADKAFDCKPAATSYASKFECLRIRAGGEGHGFLGMEGGLQQACRHYWCQVGMAAGLDGFGKVGKKIGFGETYGVLEAESPGTLPTPEWWEKRGKGNRAWSETDTASLAEGFGYARVNVLQMAVLAATVANRGHVPQPVLMHGTAPTWRADLVKDGLPEGQIQRLREGMRLAVNSDEGASRAARSDKAVIAGSAGALKMEGGPQEWFIGFAPYEAPRLAFAIYSETGNTPQSGAAALARRLVEEALALPEDGSGQVLPLEDTVDRADLRRKLEQFGTQRDAIAGAVSQAQKDTGTGLLIKSRKIEDWAVTLRCEAADLNQAVLFMDKLRKRAKEFRLMWQFPVPQPIPDGGGKRVMFQATAKVELDDQALDTGFRKVKRAPMEVHESLKTLEELYEVRNQLRQSAGEGPLSTAAQAAMDKLRKSEQILSVHSQVSQVPAKSVRVGQMSSADAERWKAVQKAAALADLPLEAMAHTTGAEPKGSGGAFNTTQFWFSAPRDKVHAWLMASLSERAKKAHATMPPWPEAPALFHRTYFTGEDCTITLHSLDGKTVFVDVTRRRNSPMITPPTPRPTAPRALDGVVHAETPGAASPWLPRFTENDPFLSRSLSIQGN